MHELVVDDGQLDDAPGDLRCHRDDIGAHGGVARPRCPHIGVPHRPAEQHGKRDRHQGDQERNDRGAAPGRRASCRLGRPAGIAIIRRLAALRFGFSDGHGELSAR